MNKLEKLNFLHEPVMWDSLVSATDVNHGLVLSNNPNKKGDSRDCDAYKKRLFPFGAE
jgi:hypothetical protein